MIEIRVRNTQGGKRKLREKQGQHKLQLPESKAGEPKKYTQHINKGLKKSFERNR